jgi:hypothetical protein
MPKMWDKAIWGLLALKYEEVSVQKLQVRRRLGTNYYNEANSGSI